MLEAAVSSTGCSGVNGFMVPCRSGGITILTGEEQSASDVCNQSRVCACLREDLLSGLSVQQRTRSSEQQWKH